ncbi:MAG TPA: GH3 auxin-responsive promoter family protein, partial [Saprospiraceae bacterium]|nr:GH3 auxin-responsive promoter family protein [Saprospiraceae bacterium]
MGFRSFLVRPFAQHIARSIERWSADAVSCQQRVFQRLVRDARDTAFGRDHRFADIRSHEDFCRAVPVRAAMKYRSACTP